MSKEQIKVEAIEVIEIDESPKVTPVKQFIRKLKPKFPYVEAVKEKIHTDNATKHPQRIIESVFIDCRGVQGTLPSLLEFQRNGGLKIVGYGNLESHKFDLVRSFLDGVTGQSGSPELNAVADSVMTQRIKEAANVRSSK